MKKKQAVTPKKAAQEAKTPKKVKPVKVVQEVVEESDEEEEVPQVEVVKGKKLNKKVAKPKKVVEEVPVEEEEEDDDEVDEDEDEDNEAEEEDEEVEEDEEEVAEAENNNGDDDDDDEDDNDDDDDDDDAPSEEGIGTEEPTIPSKVKSGPIDSTVPATKIVHVTKLPKKCKQINIVEAFAKYGPLEQIHIVTTLGGTAADILFKTEKAALSAIEDDKKVKVLDTIVSVSKKESNKVKNALSRDRCIHVKNLKPDTKEEQLKDYFESCGEIEYIKLVSRPQVPLYAYITFKDKSAMPAALKLHNSILNGVNIKVSANTENKEQHTFDENLTILLRNKQGLENIDVTKLQTIFAKCGEIGYIDIVCKKHVLAFITFKTEEAAQKSLKLSGKTMQEIELEIEPYSPFKKWYSIHVSNLAKDVTEEDLIKHFSKAGEISNVIHKKNFAIIRFADTDGFCKSFLYNESFIKGQIIFIEPHSSRKQSVFKKKGTFKRGFKRPNENGHSVFKAKKHRKD